MFDNAKEQVKNAVETFVSQYERFSTGETCTDYNRANNALEGIINLAKLCKSNVNFDEVSVFMPHDLLPNGKWLGKNITLNKSFFDLLGEYIPVTFYDKISSGFSPSIYSVNLNSSQERYNSILFRDYRLIPRILYP